jgi:hypothetical protein
MKKEKRYHRTLTVPIKVYDDLMEIRRVLSERFGVELKLNSVLIKIVNEKLRELKGEQDAVRSS